MLNLLLQKVANCYHGILGAVVPEARDQFLFAVASQVPRSNVINSGIHDVILLSVRNLKFINVENNMSFCG